MTNEEQMIREAKSRLFLSECSQSELYKIDHTILRTYGSDKTLSEDDYDRCYLAIRSLKDCGYLRCGISNDLIPVYKITNAGIRYMDRIGAKFGYN